MRSGTWHVVVPNGVDVAIDQFVYFSLWPSDSDNESSQTRARARGAHLLRARLLRSRVSPAAPQILTLPLPSPRPHRLKYELIRVARRPCASNTSLKQSKRGLTRSKRSFETSLERYALPPARAALRERVPKQRYDAALAAGPHALTLP